MYPNCTEIEGDVLIGDYDSTAITNLDGLNVLTALHQDLCIVNNNSLPSLSGLDNITSVGGNLMVQNNRFEQYNSGINY